MPKARRKERPPPDPAKKTRDAGFAAVRGHALFGPLLRRAHPSATDAWGIRASALRRGGLLAIDAHGGLIYDCRARAEVGEWIWSISHVLTHLGFGHTDPAHLDQRGSYTPEWRAACCVVVDRFLHAVRIPGTPSVPPGLDGDEERLARRFTKTGIPPILATAGPGGPGPDLWEDLFEGRRPMSPRTALPWGRTFAIGLAAFEGSADPSTYELTTTTRLLTASGRLPRLQLGPAPSDP